MIPFDLWPPQFNVQAMNEGWLLTDDSSENITIARLDDPASVPKLRYDEPKFANDQVANDFVFRKACGGSQCHVMAIWLQGYPVMTELQVLPPGPVVRKMQGMLAEADDGG